MLSATLGCARATTEAAGDAAQHDAAHPLDAAADAIHLTADAAPSCAIAAGVTPAIDGVADLADYPLSQQLSPGAMMGADAAAIAWDHDHLYVTMTSTTFSGPYEPLHVYVQAGQDLSTAVPSTGKEYGGLVSALPFSPTHLVAIRRVTDSGTGGPYDGVYLPGEAWATRAVALDPAIDVFASADQNTLSVKVPWTALGGCPTVLRLAVHVVHDVAGNEWKDLVPTTHTPWQAPGGGYYELDLTGSPAIVNWTLH